VVVLRPRECPQNVNEVVLVQLAFQGESIHSIFNSPPNVFVPVAFQDIQSLGKSSNVFSIRFLSRINQVMFVVSKQLIKLLTCIKSIHSKGPWASRSKLIEHVNQVVAFQLQSASTLDKCLANGLVHSLVFLVTEALHNVHQLSGRGCVHLVECLLDQKSVKTRGCLLGFKLSRRPFQLRNLGYV